MAFLQSCEEAIALGHLDIPDYFPRREGGFLFTMTLLSKWVSTTFEALFFFQVKRLKSGMENKYLNPFISLVTLHCTAVSIAKTKNVSMKTFTFLFKPEWIIFSWMLETLYIVQCTRGSISLHMPNSSVALGKEIFLSMKSIKASLLSQCCAWQKEPSWKKHKNSKILPLQIFKPCSKQVLSK